MKISSSKPQTLLMIGMSNQMAGAERVMAQLSQFVQTESDFKVESLTLKKNFRQILFSSADIIHTHLFWPGLAMRVRKIWDSRRNWVHTVHYADYRGQKWPSLKKHLDRLFIFPKVDRLVMVSAVCEEGLSRHLGQRAIANPMTLKARFVNRAINAQKPIIGTVAMFRQEKGLIDLLEAFALFSKDTPGAKLKIAGDGALRGEIEKTISKLKISSAVELCGYHENLTSFYESIDIYVQPSLSESFGLAVLEAFSYARPVIAARVGNLKKLVAGNGLLIDRDENFVKNLALGFKTVVQQHERFVQSTQNDFAHWQSVTSFDQTAGEYLKIYKEIVSPAVCVLAPLVTHAKGGLQQQLRLQTQELHRLGYRIFILQNEDPNLLQKELNAEPKSWNHVQFLMVKQPFTRVFKDNFFIARLRGVLYIVGGLWHIARLRNQMSVMHAHQLYSPTLLGVIAKKLFQIPLVVKVTASGSLGELSQLKKLPFFSLRQKAFKSINRVFALTDDMRNEVLTMAVDPQKVLIVPNSVELPTAPLKNHDFLNSEIRLLFVGRLSKEKCIETLLLAADHLASTYPNVVVDVVGGAYKSRDSSFELEALVRSFKSKVQINFWGEQKDVVQFYKNQPFFILPSSSEGMSNALLEAMAYGLVCVVSDIKANQFLIKDEKNGLLFRQGDPLALAEKIEKCVLDLRAQGPLCDELSREAQKTIELYFSKKVIGQKISDIYQEVIREDLL